MVSFSVFNELSLPLSRHNANDKFKVFFQLLSVLKKRGLNQIRMNHDFTQYEILPQTSVQKFLGQQSDLDFKRRLKSFISNSIINIKTPVINDNEEEQANQLVSCEYFYNNSSTDGGLACCDIWNTISVSFDSDEQWNTSHIIISKKTLINDDIDENEILVKHASKACHLSTHNTFFENIENESRRNITQNTFWREKEVHFPNIVVFCPEVKSQIKDLDNTVFKQAIRILRDVETEQKLITDFQHSPESHTVKNNPALRIQRTFTLNGEQTFFENHVKSFANGYRMYFLEQNLKVYIGYIGKHLPT